MMSGPKRFTAAAMDRMNAGITSSRRRKPRPGAGTKSVMGTVTEGSSIWATKVKTWNSCRSFNRSACAVAKYVGGIRNVLLVMAIFTWLLDLFRLLPGRVRLPSPS